jgi:hypothetical protein
MEEVAPSGTKMDEWTPKVVSNLGKFYGEEPDQQGGKRRRKSRKSKNKSKRLTRSKNKKLFR